MRIVLTDLKKIITILYLLSLLTNYLYSQVYNFNFFSVKDGLSQSQVRDFCHDPQGNLWIATFSGGITVYNGVESKYFTVKDGLPSNTVYSLFRSGDDRIWIGTADGFCVYDGKCFIDEDIYDSVNIDVLDIIEDNDGNIWLATSDGMWIYDGMLKRFDQEKLDRGHINSLMRDSEDAIWIASTRHGIIKYDNRKYDCNILDELDKHDVSIIYEDKNKNIWAGTSSGEGLYCIMPDTVMVFTGKDGLAAGKITDITSDNNSNLWIGTEVSGISIFNGHTFLNITADQGIGLNRVNSVFTDDDDNIWLGLDGSGACVFQNFVFRHYTFNDNQAKFVVMTILIDNDNVKWFGTDGNGIVKYDNEEFRHITQSDGLINNHINIIYEDSKNNIWIGTDGGVNKYDGSRYYEYTVKNGLASDFIMSVLEDSLGNMWFGTNGGGVSIYNGKEFINYTDTNGLAGRSVWNLFQHSSGKIFIATSEGLTVYENGAFRSYTTEDGLVNNDVWAVAEDRYGNIWLGTDNGVSRYNGKDFLNYTKQDGLSSNVIYLMQYDNNGILWIGTEKGVDKTRLSADGEIENIRHYGYKEGFTGIECNGNAADMDPSGNIWLGTIEGVTVYDPSEDRVNIIPPKVNINNIKLFHEYADWSDHADSLSQWSRLPVNLSLKYNMNNLTFEFVGINFKFPEKVKYQYILENLDKNWSPVTRQSYADYTNIPPGKYTFKVKACNEDGVWNNDPAVFSFRIIPPFWQTIWFYALIVFCICIGIYGFITLRTRNLIKAKNRLEMQVKHRTEEVTAQKEEIEEKSRDLEIAYNDITDSVKYAKRIQEAILPETEILTDQFPESFIYYKPKSIVSGDFYFLKRVSDYFIVAAVDCTGHGVPGAFMSTIGISLLNQIVSDKNINKPSQALYVLDKRVYSSLHYKSEYGESNDGMDIALCAINLNTMTIEYAGAYRPMVLISHNELTEYKADKYTIGGHKVGDKIFNDKIIKLKKGDQIYLFSDGITDQFGGPSGKKFMIRRFKDLLVNITELSMQEQEQKIIREFKDWKGDEKQIDDILVIGIRI